ncbi:CoB--CoM heterodisulfide reductase subunit C [Methanohalobium sp.]|uniref:CoB--CoM heterodisulfide reductase subunit C n=1 Tax=Methanohalobium sp. TaxID=2837493 RepID=UPI0025FDC344|nr:CoB--CoM heterodisulfide reductase subunit C [Methanohalobium sp.]
MPESDLSEELKKTGVDILKCMQCGVCSGSCPSGRQMSLNIRKIIKKAYTNDKNILTDKDLWMCTTCYTCQERCPRGIKIVDGIYKIRTVAVREGTMLSEHRKVSHLLLETGHAVPINEETKQKREQLGLDSLPETVSKHPKALDDVKIILKSCKFDELVSKKE